MKNIFTLILIGGAGSLLSGCLASQQDMSSLQGQLKELKTTISQMQANQAELASKMEELNQNLSISNENLSQSGNQISNLSAKLDDISAALKTRVSSANEVAGGQVLQPANALLPSDLFAEAKNHFDKGSYEAAATGFKLYTAKYPESENCEQAYMYMGDAYIAMGQTKKGAVAYATVLQKFPNSKLIPAARLKYALSIVPLEKMDEAKRYLSSIVTEFPQSPEAAQAKAELAKLSK